MIKKNLKVLIITSVIILLPILAGLVLWNQLPEQIPFHWNAAGEVDGFASKPMAVFGTPLLMLALQWLCVFATYTDPKKQNHPQMARRCNEVFYVRGGVTEKVTLPFAIHTAIFLPLHLPCSAMQSSSLTVGKSMMPTAL